MYNYIFALCDKIDTNKYYDVLVEIASRYDYKYLVQYLVCF